MARRLLPRHTLFLLLIVLIIAALRFAIPDFGVYLTGRQLQILLIIGLVLAILAVVLGVRRLRRR